MQVTQPSSRRSSMKIVFVVLLHFQSISSGAQLGRSGICSIRGSLLLFWFHSWTLIVSVDVMLYFCIVWSGDCKPTMYLFPYSVHGMCNDYPSCDIAYNAVMPLSHASTRGRYSRIVGVTCIHFHKPKVVPYESTIPTYGSSKILQVSCYWCKQ